MIEKVHTLLYILLGLATPIVSQTVASQAIHTETKTSMSPREMLGMLYKGQALKASIFTICSFCAILYAQERSYIVIISMIATILGQKLSSTYRKSHEPLSSHSN